MGAVCAISCSPSTAGARVNRLVLAILSSSTIMTFIFYLTPFRQLISDYPRPFTACIEHGTEIQGLTVCETYLRL